MLSTQDRAWLAGVFDGAGSFFVNRIRKRGKEYRYSTAEIGMTSDGDVVAKVFAITKIGRLTKRTVGTKTRHVWRVNNEIEVGWIHDQMMPWLCERHRKSYAKAVRECGEKAERPAQDR